MKILEGIEKLEFVKDIYEKLSIDFTDVTVEEAFTQYNKIVDTLTPPKVETIPNGIIEGFYKQMNFGRKLSSFLDAPSTDESDVDFYTSNFIEDMIIHQLGDNDKPTHLIYGSKQYWLIYWGDDYYFIDTQGYDYARYCTKLTGFNLG